jgi:hypothetical protein
LQPRSRAGEAIWAFGGQGGFFMSTEAGKAAYITGDYFAEPAPDVRLRGPNRRWHWAKRLRARLALALVLGARNARGPPYARWPLNMGGVKDRDLRHIGDVEMPSAFRSHLGL